MRVLTPRKAIRAKCLECSNGSFLEVRECPIKSCPLWALRSGKRPPKEIVDQEGGAEESGTILPTDDESGDSGEEEED